jgi:hypothetical protein
MNFHKGQILVFSLAMMTFIAWAHEGKHHPKPNTQEKTSFVQINELYLTDVKPIFEKKCFDCHGSSSSSAWYRNVPGAKQLIDSDIKESKEHLDMSSDFPFKSHATPLEDLDAIQSSIDKNEMPPFRYRIMHSDSTLTTAEKEKVSKWVQFGKEILKEKQTNQ